MAAGTLPFSAPCFSVVSVASFATGASLPVTVMVMVFGSFFTPVSLSVAVYVEGHVSILTHCVIEVASEEREGYHR
ncbi:hypothetical protein O9993_05570 [Vibrio lentus]|nr:hypothetical protein [Vibrio lentus]